VGANGWSDWSDAPFTVRTPTITLTSPTGGQNDLAKQSGHGDVDEHQRRATATVNIWVWHDNVWYYWAHPPTTGPRR